MKESLESVMSFCHDDICDPLGEGESTFHE